MRSFFILLTLFISTTIFAQSSTAEIWYFGDAAGLNFNSGDPVALEDSNMEGFEGCATICNNEGEVLFYTNGKTVWRADHQVMTNGTSLAGSDNAIQSSLIVPTPNLDDNLYYLFTVDTEIDGAYQGFSYSIVDMDGFLGWGEVTDEKNIPLWDNPVYESLTAVDHANGIDVWILTQERDTWIYEAYLLTVDGISTVPVQSDVSIVQPLGFQGCMKASPNGLKVASTYSGSRKAEIMDFDTYTGLLSNPVDLELVQDNSVLGDWAPYSCEFSPDGFRFYLSHLDYGPIIQYDLTQDDIPATRTPIGLDLGTSNNIPYSTLQLGPNGKIYAACFGKDFVSVINDPNELGMACNFQDSVVMFETAECKFGLPQFVQSSFIENSFTYNEACRGDTVFFAPLNVYDSLYWDFGDIASGDDNYSTEEYPFHIYETPGNYQVSLTAYLAPSEIVSNSNLTIPGPLLELAPGDTVCEGDYVELDATTPGAVSYLWFDDNPNAVRWVQPPGTYWVTVDEGLCISSDTVYYDTGDCAYMNYPNIFTPNNDGVNDYFTYLQSWYVLKFEMKIYDRWGNLVFESIDQEKSWDGTNLNGQELADGVYFLTVKYSGIKNEIETIEQAVQITRQRER